MRTYPLHRDNGKVYGFEISNMWVTVGTIKRILRPVDGVSNVKRARKNDYRATFVYYGEPVAVWEPWGDSSRYAVVPINDDSDINLEPIHEAFRLYKGPIASLWSRVAGGT